MFISIWAVPNAADADGRSKPLPYSGVCDKQQFATLLSKADKH